MQLSVTKETVKRKRRIKQIDYFIVAAQPFLLTCLASSKIDRLLEQHICIPSSSESVALWFSTLFVQSFAHPWYFHLLITVHSVILSPPPSPPPTLSLLPTTDKETAVRTLACTVKLLAKFKMLWAYFFRVSLQLLLSCGMIWESTVTANRKWKRSTHT